MRKRLDEIADVTKLAGFEFTKYMEYVDDGEIIAIRALNLKEGRLVLDDVKRITKNVSEKLPRSQLHKYDIVLSYTGTIGEAAQIMEEGKYHLAPNVAKVVPKCDVVDPRYLFHYICSREFKQQMKNYAHGSTQPTVPMATIRELTVPVYDYETEKKIANILTSISDKIEKNMEVNENLLQQAEAIYKAWFYDRFAEGESSPWPKTTIGDITSLVVRGITPKYNDATDQLVINQKCIRNHMVDLTPARHHLPKVITEKWLMQGDLLINSTGEGTLGRAAQIWFVPNNLTVDSHVTIVRPKTAVLRNYIGLWGLTHEAEIESLHTGSTGQTELPRERVKAMELPLPDESALSRFNELITPMTQAIVKNQQENIRLAELRDTLLPRLMSGELDVSELDL